MHRSSTSDVPLSGNCSVFIVEVNVIIVSLFALSHKTCREVSELIWPTPDVHTMLRIRQIQSWRAVAGFVVCPKGSYHIV